jgi:heme exporter protein A
VQLVVRNLTCRRGERTVFRDVSFTLRAGEALIVTGRNGAGKSSLIAILAGLLHPASGTVAVEGTDDLPASEHVNLVGHREGLKSVLTAAENLAFAQKVLGASARSPVDALDAVGLAHAADLPVAYLSAGQHRRVALARLLVSARPVWLLDEPTSALDAASQTVLTGLMEAHLSAGGLIVAATHGPLGLGRVQELKLGGIPTGEPAADNMP